MKERIDYFDISPRISPKSAVFPGDTPFSRKVALDYDSGNLLLSSINTTVHIGAHVDAPNHYSKDGEPISDRDLSYYFGRCQVISVKIPRGERLYPKFVTQPIEAPRVLFKTRSFPDPNNWNSDFNSLSPALIDFVAEQGVRLVGIDTPSIDPEQSKELESHNAVARHGLAILEGIVLDDVPDGIYTLIALPLKIEEADASPVRAVLFKNPDFVNN
jgi:arylformamidase